MEDGDGKDRVVVVAGQRVDQNIRQNAVDVVGGATPCFLDHQLRAIDGVDSRAELDQLAATTQID